MKIQCECGKFRAELTKFPEVTPGRLKCYCDDCQAYLHYLKRTDLLDANGGSEIIPIYPSDIKVEQGEEFLKCVRLSPKGMFRFATKCCNTPIANTDAKRPWAGVHRRVFTATDPHRLDQDFKEIRSSILGKFAHGTPPPGTPQTFDFKGFKIVMPFILKGIVLGRARPSPFFNGEVSVAAPYILSQEERAEALKSAGHPR
jgi:hypothetical protein